MVVPKIAHGRGAPCGEARFPDICAVWLLRSISQPTGNGTQRRGVRSAVHTSSGTRMLKGVAQVQHCTEEMC